MHETKIFSVRKEKELVAVAEYLIAQMQSTTKVAFLYGDLGAGKTTFVKYLMQQLGTNDDTSSPTYGLVNDYETDQGTFYHIDLYRINDTHEAMDMGIEEYLYSNTYCFVEWPQVIEQLVGEYWAVNIESNVDGIRTITLQY